MQQNINNIRITIFMYKNNNASKPSIKVIKSPEVEEEQKRTTISLFIDITEKQPDFFSSNLEDLLTHLLFIASQQNNDDYILSFLNYNLTHLFLSFIIYFTFW
jgi:hypothetical protein